jgi:hypothetical protein
MNSGEGGRGEGNTHNRRVTTQRSTAQRRALQYCVYKSLDSQLILCILHEFGQIQNVHFTRTHRHGEKQFEKTQIFKMIESITKILQTIDHC